MNAEDDHNYVSSRNNNSNSDYNPNSDDLEINPQRPQNTDHDYLATSPNNINYAESGDNIDEAVRPANEVQSNINLDVNVQENNNVPNINEPTSSSSLSTPTGHVKKRKRLSLASPNANTPKVKANTSDIDLDEEDGITCPICLEHWEMSGEHRLVSLKCGHLFGNSCIRRWLNESSKQSGHKLCPQCKTKATYKDIRCLYAKRLRAIDRSEEYSLREKVKQEECLILNLKTELSTYKLSVSLATKKIESLEADNNRLKEILRKGGVINSSSTYSSNNVRCLPTYKLFLDRNIEICKESGCRVMINADKNSSLIVSQKSSQSLFPGYGVRFIDTQTFRTSNFLHTSAKLVRDISLNFSQHVLATASMEIKTKIYDIRTRHLTMMLSASDNSLSWACAMDYSEREHFIYIGGNLGSTFIYDMRFPSAVLDEIKNEGDCSPVINVCPIPANKYFPNAGFVVCKLRSVWFHEYESSDGTVKSTRFDIEGPFISMKYDDRNDTLLISARNNARYTCARYILGRLEKIDETPVFNTIVSFYGSKASPVMTRSTQIGLTENTLVAGYLQDVKMLALFDEKRSQRIHSMPVSEIVYDICAIYGSDPYLAALTETKCRIYKLTSTS
ncbi:E3 ubiquitin-protein ligase RFWD3-like [Teleopsis dalmanni]|uniref:E3 ubiquitin-protein ligase RFWD3-like n=1 Tax=Teleopsis dalmanni TaxID=139649 RepID=UPI0018CC903A|nr:E3 ubiquitin-protein ligase RFWD3-like [Teleopsis dalmanni]